MGLVSGHIKLVIWLVFVVSAMWNIAGAQTVCGDWSGKLRVGERQLRLVIHASQDSVIMDSPDQGSYGIVGEDVYVADDSISFRVPRIMMSYAGRRENDTISGIFQQMGMKVPLSFVRGVNKVERPQTPVPPFPYISEEVTIENEEGGAVLAGTLCIPANATVETPVAVLVSGSGLQNRDEELFEHKPFAVIADYLARNGIASLRYDDRGFGKSKGNGFNATTADFASDAQAAVDWLRSQGRFGKIGIIGHSEGGQIAYMLGAKEDGPDFIVSVAGPVVKGTKTIAYQNKVALMKSGVSQRQAEDFAAAVERMLEYKLKADFEPVPEDKAEEVVTEIYPQRNDDASTAQLAATLKNALMPKGDNTWMMCFLGYDPGVDVKKLKVPAFIIYGEKDRQVPPSLNLDLARSLTPEAKVECYPGLNHLMQHAVTGNVEEYSSITETFSPQLLKDIADFIQSL